MREVQHASFAMILSVSVAAKRRSAQEKPQPLPTVPVTASTELVRSAKLREFDRRRNERIGRFLTEADPREGSIPQAE